MSKTNFVKGMRDFSVSRTLVESALKVYVDNGLSVKKPVQCLDLSSAREEGMKWTNTHGPSVIVMAKPSSNICEQNNENKLKESNSSSRYALIEQTDFNFIYVECITEGSSYFDCVFRKIARNGLFALSTSDDPALYGRPAEPALRCYSGLIARTFYAPEMAVRLILAAMARSSARFSKSIEVLLSFAIKNTITIIVKVKKGADAAVKSLKEIKTLIHCTVCEERAFLPNNDGYVIEDLRQYLSCDCAAQSVGRTVMALGPLWAGPLGSSSFATYLLPYTHHSLQLTTFLQDLVSELRCDKYPKTEKNKEKDPVDQNSLDGAIKGQTLTEISAPLKRKAEFEQCDSKCKLNRLEEPDLEPSPAFYYNLHKHKPKSAPHLLKVDKTIEILQRLGFRASRTHFDRAAVKTNATLSQLHSALSQVT